MDVLPSHPGFRLLQSTETPQLSNHCPIPRPFLLSTSTSAMAAAAETLKASNVFWQDGRRFREGKIKFSPQGFSFRINETKEQKSVSSAEMDGVELKRIALGHQLLFSLKTGALVSVAGFSSDDLQGVIAFIKKHFYIPLTSTEVALEGWNWGLPVFQETLLCFQINDKSAFEVPLRTVESVNTANNQVSIDFAHTDDVEPGAQVVDSMRFFFPNDPETPTETRITDFVEPIRALQSSGADSGPTVFAFPQVSCLVPKASFEIKFYPQELLLHGRSNDHHISFDVIARIFSLPVAPAHRFVVLALEKPLRQGKSRYDAVILKFASGAKLKSLSLNLADVDVAERLGFTNDEEEHTFDEDTEECQTFLDLINKLTDKRLDEPIFPTGAGEPYFKCAVKADQGYLYFVKKGLLFVHKPYKFIPYSAISEVSFDKVSRAFAMTISRKDGLGDEEFRGFDSSIMGQIQGFFAERQIRIDAFEEHMAMQNKGDESDEDRYRDQLLNDDTDESDEEFDASAQSSSSSAASDASSLEEEVLVDADELSGKTKTKKKRRSSSKGSGDEDEDEDEDEDFDPEEDDEEEAKPKKTKAKKAAAKSKAAGAKRATKKKKDPNAPKKPRSAYSIFQKEVWAKLKQEKPDEEFSALAKEVSTQWKAIDAEEKKRFTEMAKKEKEAYDLAMESYVPPEDDDVSAAPKAKAKRKPKGAAASAKKAKTPAKQNIKSAEMVLSESDTE
eukprot:m.9720 g.9720  ORF g.9720 m.9720 type:complete len:730 (+) comp5485_c0_seq1:61-2250(+)